MAERPDLVEERRRLLAELREVTPEADNFSLYFTLVSAGLVPEAPPEIIALAKRFNADGVAFAVWTQQIDEVCSE
jgi:hypothetical protein